MIKIAEDLMTIANNLDSVGLISQAAILDDIASRILSLAGAPDLTDDQLEDMLDDIQEARSLNATNPALSLDKANKILADIAKLVLSPGSPHKAKIDELKRSAEAVKAIAENTISFEKTLSD